jgi:hypothetical protein
VIRKPLPCDFIFLYCYHYPIAHKKMLLLGREKILSSYIASQLSTYTSGKRAFGLDPLATSPQNDQAAREALVPARNDPLVPV